MKQRLSLTGYRLSLDGLTLSYTKNSIYYCASFDPCATCAFLQQASAIEDFTLDKNSEPVILYSDNNEPQGYGFELWHQFVKSFPLCEKLAFLLLEYKIQREEHAQFQATVNHLLSPLAA
jgi:hypothetical protein